LCSSKGSIQLVCSANTARQLDRVKADFTTYALIRGNGHWAAELKGSETSGGDHFGVSVAISGNASLVGAVLAGSNSGGRAYVFEA
jgi:hypothetical protein